MHHNNLIDQLYEIGALQFGDFQLKSGQQSPFYIDLRLVISYPTLLQTIGEMVWMKAKNLKFARICGVPYTALPLATCVSIAHQVPMVMKRKEAKHHGTKKMVEGVFNEGDECLVIEDIITSGQSLIETIEPLQEAGLVISNVIVIIDREQGGKMLLEKQGLHVDSILTISQIVAHLHETKKLSEEAVKNIHHFIHSHQIVF